MPDVEKILKLVAEGALTPEEADEILNALNASHEHEAASEPPPRPRRSECPTSRATCGSRSRSEAGR